MTTTHALRDARHAAHAYTDRLADRTESAFETARQLTRDGSDAVRDRAYELREQALRAAYAGRQLVREHPLRSVAIAVAAVGLTLAIVSLFSSRARR